ncbi:MAG: CarD family transcriptional regulator [Faecousia sp.]
MFQVGDLVVYGVHGVCRVVDQEERLIDKKRLTYLALEPVGQGDSKFLVPTQNAAAMAKLQHVLSKEELETMVDSEEVRADGWIRDENQRKQTYRELINSGDRARLMRMVHTLYRHRAAQAAAGRKNHLCDENFLHDAEKLLVGEVSIVLNLDPEQARSYIHKKLKEDA